MSRKFCIENTKELLIILGQSSISFLQVTRKIIRRYVSPDGTEKEDIIMQGTPQEPVTVEEGDGYSKVVKRVVLKSDSEQSEVRSSTSLVMGQSCSAPTTSVPDSYILWQSHSFLNDPLKSFLADGKASKKDREKQGVGEEAVVSENMPGYRL